MESSSRTGSRESGWAAFAGVVMFLVGALQAFWGLGGILNDDIVVVGGEGAIIADITLWGWVHLILGTIIALVGVGLLRGGGVSRVLAIALLTVSAISHIVWFPAAPLWAFLIILLEVTIIYQLTVRWDQQARWE
jgi:hypothetical protein